MRNVKSFKFYPNMPKCAGHTQFSDAVQAGMSPYMIDIAKLLYNYSIRLSFVCSCKIWPASYYGLRNVATDATCTLHAPRYGHYPDACEESYCQFLPKFVCFNRSSCECTILIQSLSFRRMKPPFLSRRTAKAQKSVKKSVKKASKNAEKMSVRK